jgi:hypothetical protein
MLVNKKEYGTEKTGTYVECVFDSTNLLKTTYFPMLKRLYISFTRGGTYSYENISEELYKEFEGALSQGKFFTEKIRSNSNQYPVRKEFTLYPSEINEAKKLINEFKYKNGILIDNLEKDINNE